MPAETLSCPTCGAPVASLDAANCEHCGARLATVACPSCFGMIFQGSKFCPHCGAKVVREEVEAATPISCPRCKAQMEAVQVGDAQLRECPHCEGIWVDNQTFEKICEDREEQSAVLGLAFTVQPSESAGEDLTVRYYPCPVCKALMNRVNFAHCSGVIVDVCRDHGTWFDKDELHRIVEFIRAGGFDKARAKEIEELQRQRSELKAERLAQASSTGAWQEPQAWPTTKYDLVGLGVSAAASVLNAWLKK